MASGHARNIVFRNIPRKCYASQAAAQHQPSFSLKSSPEMTTTPEGITIISNQTCSPLSNISIFVKGGSRYEGYENVGISHVLRCCFGLKSENHTLLHFIRQMEMWGGKFDTYGGPELIQYSNTVPKAYAAECAELVIEKVMRPLLRSWEIQYLFHKINYDTRLKMSDEAKLMDLLHKAAFRNTSLGNSIYFPSYKLDKLYTDRFFNEEDFIPGYMFEDFEKVRDFYKKTHTGPRMVIVGSGVDHDVFMKIINNYPIDNTEGAKSLPATYHGGEIRVENESKQANVAIACPGVSVTSKDLIPLTVVQHILGEIRCRTNLSKVQTAINSAGGNGVASTFNINYEDAGLFGIYITEDASKAKETVKAVVKSVRDAKISQSDLEYGKNMAKTAIYSKMHSLSSEIDTLGRYGMHNNSIFDPAEIAKQIDQVTVSSAQNALANVLKGKISMSSLGGIHYVPYIEEL